MPGWHIRNAQGQPAPAERPSPAKPTASEDALWEQMRSGQLGARFERQQPVGTYRADFLCAELMLVIELDTRCHLAWRESDARRTRWMRAQGYTVLRFATYDVHRNLDGVVLAIGDEILRLRRGTLPR